LLRELTVNARINITELANHYDISRSRISRRIKRLRELVIRDDRLVYDQSTFDLTYAQMIEGCFRADDELDMQSFYSFLSEGYLPFSTTVIMDGERFLWFTPAPPSYVPQLTRFMWQHADDIRVHQLDLSTSRTYYFYHKNLERKGQWRTDQEYIVDTPLDTFAKLQERQSQK
jgi:DNA-binding Lrp family transcriptional regulator